MGLCPRVTDPAPPPSSLFLYHHSKPLETCMVLYQMQGINTLENGLDRRPTSSIGGSVMFLTTPMMLLYTVDSLANNRRLTSTLMLLTAGHGGDGERGWHRSNRTVSIPKLLALIPRTNPLFPLTPKKHFVYGLQWGSHCQLYH